MLKQIDITRDKVVASWNKVFVCPEESEFYSLCLQFLVFQSPVFHSIVEFGSGDGTPVLEALKASHYSGEILGYEIDPAAAFLANNHILAANQRRYRVINSCFFEASIEVDRGTCLVANPPYIPALSAERLLLPGLWGGPDGSSVLCRLMDQDISYLLLLVPGISNPERVILHSLKQGYFVHNFLLTSLPFGQYTCQDYVQDWLLKMHKNGQAFFFDRHYLLAGVLFGKKMPLNTDHSASLLRILTFSQRNHSTKPKKISRIQSPKKNNFNNQIQNLKPRDFGTKQGF